ncbi:MAG: hypothetical protein PHY47_08535 [Lachnospiraceae bacterium]|nr:hypothetical protein [Lachnospiraceae bacterium]
MKIDKKENKVKKEDDDMNATAVKIDNNFFNEFLKINKSKIDTITPKNPTISKDDEWNKETCWDTDYEELKTNDFYYKME